MLHGVLGSGIVVVVGLVVVEEADGSKVVSFHMHIIFLDTFGASFECKVSPDHHTDFVVTG